MCHNLSTRARRSVQPPALGLPSAYTSTIATKLAARASGRFRQISRATLRDALLTDTDSQSQSDARLTKGTVM
jgi:hypothetical protein